MSLSHGWIVAYQSPFSCLVFWVHYNLGCRGAYTPFGSVHAQRTAILALDLVMKLVSGEETRNPVVSWKGPDKAFRAAGFQTSDRYKLSEQDLFETRYAYVNRACAVCGGAD